MDGILNVFKEEGYTSHDVVARLRGILHQKKIGHTGTLDPAAVGVLPVCLGNATKAAGMLTDTDKTYRVVMRLGVETDTQDMTGTVLDTCEVTVSEKEVEAAVRLMEGDIYQIPPMYSAVKVNGRRLYSLAREGKEVERKPRLIHISGITINSISLPLVDMTVNCSKGTYIRTICHDIGMKLGCKAAMEKLMRIRSGMFFYSGSFTLGQIERAASDGSIADMLIPVEAVFASYPAYLCSEEKEQLLRNGGTLGIEDLTLAEDVPDPCMSANMGLFLSADVSADHLPGAESAGDSVTESGQHGHDMIRVKDSKGRFIAIYAFDVAKGSYKPIKMFLTS